MAIDVPVAIGLARKRGQRESDKFDDDPNLDFTNGCDLVASQLRRVARNLWSYMERGLLSP